MRKEHKHFGYQHKRAERSIQHDLTAILPVLPWATPHREMEELVPGKSFVGYDMGWVS